MRPSSAQSDRWVMMAMTLLVWLCTLPLVALLVLPFFGWQMAGLVALGLLLLLLPICWAICVFKIKNHNTAERRDGNDLAP